MAKIFLDILVTGWERHTFDESQLPEIIQAIQAKGIIPETDEIEHLFEFNETVYDNERISHLFPTTYEVYRLEKDGGQTKLNIEE